MERKPAWQDIELMYTRPSQSQNLEMHRSELKHGYSEGSRGKELSPNLLPDFARLPLEFAHQWLLNLYQSCDTYTAWIKPYILQPAMLDYQRSTAEGGCRYQPNQKHKRLREQRKEQE